MEISLKKFLNGKDVSQKGAFSNKGKLSFVIKCARKEGVRKIRLIVSEDEFYEGFKTFSKDLKWVRLDEGFDVFTVSLNLNKFPLGIYFLNLELEGKNKTYLYKKFDYRRQMTVFEDKEYLKPQNGIIYHIFVDRFFRSGKSNVKETSVLNDDWENGIPEFAEKPGEFLLNNTCFGGDLYGIAEKIDYIASLGTKYIYLSPIFDSFSNHKYDTGDYLKVDSSLGGEEALKYLSKRAEEKGIKLILDGVFNHTGSHSVYFNKEKSYDGEGAFNSKDSPYYSWFNFRNFPYEYECWWNIKTLPRVDSKNDSYIDFICNKVLEKWDKYNLGGWRLDVADELSDKFLERFREKVKKDDKNSVIIGEVWENASNKISYGERRKYFLGRELDSVMNYPVREGIISLFKNKNTEEFLYNLKVTEYHYPDHVKNRLMNLLSTHDTERIINVLSFKNADKSDNTALSTLILTKEERKKAEKLLKCSYALLYFLPGQPSVFYGDEIGMEGWHDPFCRMPFKWKETKSSSLLKFFRKLGKIRLSHEVFADGKLKIIYESEKSFILEREDENERIIFPLNLNSEIMSLKLCQKSEDLISGKEKSVFTLKENEYALILLNKNTKIKDILFI